MLHPLLREYFISFSRYVEGLASFLSCKMRAITNGVVDSARSLIVSFIYIYKENLVDKDGRNEFLLENARSMDRFVT